MIVSRLPIMIIVCAGLLLAACSSSETTTSARRPSSVVGAPPLPADISSGRRAVVTESYRWLGVPYRYGGNTKRGVDCSGLVNAVFGKYGVGLPRRARDLYRKGRKRSREDLAPADLVFSANTAGRGITHVGIYLGRDRFIHASSSAGVVISSLEDSYYRRHYAGARMIIK
ncbi:MAG: NlpC/P60 family protein [Bacteroidota bacterium]|nr:NlpC/P60 family protein [Bacteroidota bacterium]